MTALAPEARRNTARSGAKRNSGKLPFPKFANPWQGVTDRAALKVTFIKRQTMRLQQNLEFLEERNASMMFFLPLDVPVHFGQHRLTYGERPISFLPFESSGLPECSRNPTRGVRLQLTNALRDRFVLPQFRQDVNVVRTSVNDQRDSTFVTNRAAKILMRSRTNFWRQPGFAPLRRKDDVIQQIAIGGTHAAAISVAPLRGSVRFGLYPEFRVAPLRALVPAHPSGATTFPPSPLTCFHPSIEQSDNDLICGCRSLCSWSLRLSHSAPEARRNAARSAAKRNSGGRSIKFFNPCQGVADLRVAQAST